jgi:hypothetical protein
MGHSSMDSAFRRKFSCTVTASGWAVRSLFISIPKEVRACLDSEESKLGESGVYAREFAAFQKSLFEMMLKETGGNRAEAAGDSTFIRLISGRNAVSSM